MAYNFWSGFDAPAFDLGQSAKRSVQRAQPKKGGKGGTLTSLISEGGALGGAAIGAGIGSAVPVVGTAIGGIIGAGLGAFGGRLTENKVRDDEFRVGDAAEEGALTAALSGPLRLGKYATTAAKGLKAGGGLDDALMGAADAAGKVSIRGAIGKGATKKSGDMAIRGFKFTPTQLSNFRKKFGEDASETIARHNLIGGNADSFNTAIGQLNQQFDELVQTAGTIKKTELDKSLRAAYGKLLKSAPSDTKRLGQQVKSEVNSLLGQFGDEISAPELNAVRRMFDDLVTYTNKAADPARYGVNKRVADTLRRAIQKASGSDDLKNTGLEISKLRQLVDSVALQGNRGRGSNPLGLSTMLGGATGGGIGLGVGGATGGIPGALLGIGAERVINSPAAIKGASKAAGALGGRLTQSGANMASRGARSAVMGTTRGIAGAGLADAVLSSGQRSNQGVNTQMMPMTSGTSTSIPMNSNNDMMGQSYPQGDQMSSPQSQYPLENAIMDMQRDPQNADYYMKLYEFANQGQQQQGLELGNTAIARISDFESGIAALDDLGQRLQGSGVNQPFIGDIRRRNPFDVEAQDLNSAVRTVRQLVGRALEGGVLRKEDEVKYEQMLPKIGDNDDVAMRKLANVRKLLTTNLQAFMQNQALYSGGGGLEDALMSAQQPQAALPY